VANLEMIFKTDLVYITPISCRKVNIHPSFSTLYSSSPFVIYGNYFTGSGGLGYLPSSSTTQKFMNLELFKLHTADSLRK
jgi:hypothetical protein